MKKALLIGIIVCLLLTMVAFPVNAAEDCVYLSDLTPTSTVIRNANWPWTMDLCSNYKVPISIGGTEYEKGLSAHASDDGKPTTEIVFDISSFNYNTFSAVFGKDFGSKGTTNQTKVAYAVLVDDVIKAEGTVGGLETADIKVDITGAKKIALQILTGGDGPGDDCGSYANAKLTNSSSYLSDLTPVSTVIRNANWPWTMDLCSYYKTPISVGGTEYAKGLSAHASDDGKPVTEIVFDISSLNCNTFSAVFGKDFGSKGTTNQTKVAYAVLVDDVIKAEGTVGGLETADIKVDITGAKKLALQILTGGDGSGDDCASYADAKLYNEKVETPEPPVDPDVPETPENPVDPDVPETPENPTVPETGDNFTGMITLTVLVLASVTCMAIFTKKRSSHN